MPALDKDEKRVDALTLPSVPPRATRCPDTRESTVTDITARMSVAAYDLAGVVPIGPNRTVEYDDLSRSATSCRKRSHIRRGTSRVPDVDRRLGSFRGDTEPYQTVLPDRQRNDPAHPVMLPDEYVG